MKTNTKRIELLPGVFSHAQGNAVGQNAIDGIVPSNTGDDIGFLKCAIASYSRSSELRVFLLNQYVLMSIKLYLRDGDNRQRWQNGLKVIVNDSNVQEQQCGDTYNQFSQGQNATFICGNGILSSFFRLTLDHGQPPTSTQPIQICEVEVLVGKFNNIYCMFDSSL